MMRGTDVYIFPTDTVLTLILQRCEKETVDEKAVQRVLEPVLRMIREGRFRKRYRVTRLAKIAAVVGIAVAVSAQEGIVREQILEIPHTTLPLHSRPSEMETLSGRVMLRDAGLEGVELTLVDLYGGSGAPEWIAVTGSGGAFYFESIPDGVYLLRATLPMGLAFSDGKRETVMRVYSQGGREGMDLWVYEIGE